MTRLFHILFILCTTLACNPTRIVKPLEKGKTVIGLNAGGTLIKLGAAVTPLPLTSVYAAHGFRDRVTAIASLHTTALLFGVVQSDLGINYGVFRQKKYLPGISMNLLGNFMIDTWQGKFSFYPQIDVNAYWSYSDNSKLLYLSMNNWMELRTEKAHHEKQTTRWLPSFGLGHQWDCKKYKWQVEVKYIAPTESNKNLVVDYISINSKGALGIYLGVCRKF